MLCFVEGMQDAKINFKGEIRDEYIMAGSGMCSVLKGNAGYYD